MAGKRFAELEPTRQNAILEVAAEEFAEHGYQGASVNRLIAEAGLSKGQLYYYFDDKADLFATVVEHSTAQLMERATLPSLDQLTPENFWNSLRDLSLAWMDLFQAEEWSVRLARSFLRYLREEPNAPAVRPMMERLHQWVTDYLSRGQALEVVRKDLPLPLLVNSALAVDEAGGRWLMEHWDELAPEERVSHAEAQADLIRDMLHAKNEGWED